MATTTSIRLLDKNAKKASFNIHFDDAITYDEVVGFLTANLPLLDDVVGGVITGVVIYQDMDLGALGLKAGAVAASVGAKEGALWGVTTNGGLPHSIFVPTIIDSNVSGDTIGGAEWAAWTAHMLAGQLVGGTQVHPSNRNGDALLATRFSRSESRTT